MAEPAEAAAAAWAGHQARGSRCPSCDPAPIPQQPPRLFSKVCAQSGRRARAGGCQQKAGPGAGQGARRPSPAEAGSFVALPPQPGLMNGVWEGLALLRLPQ